ncbi:hypothetical protein CGMCC3_g6522 [Colletotrichum fructicola]|nr:uncharacterized protein CGMCC3_g6522 [Colletotrichum fructicola]KAE9577434.1 hypothetical protein CGMCC3_g6522 [Colletotrichum fructicola]
MHVKRPPTPIKAPLCRMQVRQLRAELRCGLLLIRRLEFVDPRLLPLSWAHQGPTIHLRPPLFWPSPVGHPSSRATLDQSWTWAPSSGLANSPDLIWPARGPFPSLSPADPLLGLARASVIAF